MINIFDLIIVGLLIVCFIQGFKKGALPELVAFIGTIISIVVSFIFMNKLGDILCNILPFFNFAGEFKGLTSLNVLMYQALAFFIIFSVLSGILYIVFKLSGAVQKVLNFTVVLLLPSKIIGGIIATITAYLCLFVISVTLMIPLHNITIYKESTVIKTICYETPILSDNSKGIINSIKEVYDLGEKIGKNKVEIKEANEEIINTMIKYKVVKKELVDKLIERNKLKI